MSQEDIDFEDEDFGDQELNDDDGQFDYKDIYPPNDFKKGLQACTNCYFILSKLQWSQVSDSACPNCGDDIYTRKPTAKFQGITCITNPGRSWQTQRMKVVKRIQVRVPGAYAISIPEDNDPIQNQY